MLKDNPNRNDNTDHLDLLAALKKNDEVSLRHFYQKNYYKIEHYINQNGGTIEETRDIYQEAFIAVWRNIQLDRFHPQNETSLDGYIYQIAKNKWVDHLRATKRIRVVDISELYSAADLSTDHDEQEEQMLDSIKEKFKLLGGSCRDLLERFYYKKQSMRTISVAMQWTEATARNNKYRCIQRLREMLPKKT